MTRQERVVAPHQHLTRPNAPFIPSSSERWDSGPLTIPIVAETDHFAPHRRTTTILRICTIRFSAERVRLEPI
jgi:hypothetical protein